MEKEREAKNLWLKRRTALSYKWYRNTENLCVIVCIFGYVKHCITWKIIDFLFRYKVMCIVRVDIWMRFSSLVSWSTEILFILVFFATFFQLLCVWKPKMIHVYVCVNECKKNKFNNPNSTPNNDEQRHSFIFYSRTNASRNNNNQSIKVFSRHIF